MEGEVYGAGERGWERERSMGMGEGEVHGGRGGKYVWGKRGAMQGEGGEMEDGKVPNIAYKDVSFF